MDNIVKVSRECLVLGLSINEPIYGEHFDCKRGAGKDERIYTRKD